MMKIKTLAELATPDSRSLRFTPNGISMNGTLKPEDAAELQQRAVAHCDLNPDVPAETQMSFERLRTLHAYGVLYYETFTVAHDLAWLVLEQAFRDRFMTYYNGTFTFVNTVTKEEEEFTAREFDEVFETVRRGGRLFKNFKLKSIC